MSRSLFQNRVSEIVKPDGTVNRAALELFARDLDALAQRVAAPPPRSEPSSAGSANTGGEGGSYRSPALVVANNINASVGHAVHYTRGELSLADNRSRVATHFVVRQDGARGTVTLLTSGTARALLAQGAGLGAGAELYLHRDGLLTDDVTVIQGSNRRLLDGVKYFQVLATKAQPNAKDFVNANWNVSLTARGD